MKFTELTESKALPDESSNKSLTTKVDSLVDEEKPNVPKKSEKDPNGYDGWYQLCKREADRVNKILAYTYGEWFSMNTENVAGKVVNSTNTEKSNGAVSVYLDDDSWYFELVFNAAVPYAFDTAMDIIEDYKKIVGLPTPDAYIFEDISEDKKDKESGEKQKFFRFVSWLGDCCNATTVEAFVKLCDWFDKIKQMCYFTKDVPDEVILKRIELNNTWNKLFGLSISKQDAQNVAKKAEMWNKAIESWKGAELLKGNKI